MTQPEDASKMDLLVEFLKQVKELKGVPRESSPYLRPEDSPFAPPGRWGISAYELSIAQALLEPMELEARGEGHKEIASLVCLPAFEPEWAVWVAGGRKTGFSALLTEAQENIWYSIQTAKTEFSLAPTRMDQCQLPLGCARAICDVWRTILSQTRYPKKPELDGCDGVYYHFAYWSAGSTSQAGKTWSPEETTVPGRLAVLGRTLKDCIKDRANQDVFLKVIDDHVAWLQTHSQRL